MILTSTLRITANTNDRILKEKLVSNMESKIYYSNRCGDLELNLKDEKMISSARSNIILVQEEKISIYKNKNSWAFVKGLSIAIAFIIGFFTAK